MVKNRLIWIPGFMATTVYLIGATAAYIRFPLAYSPYDNWLSDLGNPILNPGGAFSYNLGVVLTGLCLLLFFFGLGYWNDGDPKRRALLSIAQGTGILSALCLIVSACFPLGTQTFIHSISGKGHIFFTGFFLTFSSTVLLKQACPSKWLSSFGLFSALINFIYGAFLHSIFVAEWAAIGVFILYVLLISGNALKQITPRVAAGLGKGS